jgi:hypothetical protein
VSTADQLVITDDHRRQAKEAGVTVEQLLGIEELPRFTEEELTWKFIHGQPLVKPEKIPLLSTRMRNLHD